MTEEVRFLAGAANIKSLPKDFGMPEVAFVGKSNVGKSSLINSLTNRKKLAKISKHPGHTRQINFFSIQSKWIFADLPGYGYAGVSFGIKQNWEKLILYYLEKRPNLRLCFVLVDARHGIKPNDLSIVQLLTAFKRDYRIIFTKGDKTHHKVVENSDFPYILTSTKSKLGIDQLWKLVVEATD